MQRRLILDGVVRKRAAVIQLPATEDQSLLVRLDTLLAVNLLFYDPDRVGRVHVKEQWRP